MRITCPLLTTHVLRQDLPGTPSGWDSDLLCDDTAGAGGGPLRSESARRLTPEIRQSKFPGTPRPSVTLALAAPGPLYNSAGLRSVYRARPCATRRSLTAATARLQSLRGSSTGPCPNRVNCRLIPSRHRQRLCLKSATTKSGMQPRMTRLG